MTKSISPVTDFDHVKVAIRAAMKARRITQKDLAGRLGLTTKHVSKVLTGSVHGTLDVIEAMAHAAGLVITAVPPVQHEYLSTSCLHGHHDYCQSGRGAADGGETWAKRPSQCKFCGAPCRCPCHATTTGASDD